VDRLRAAGVPVEQHPVDKDASDLGLSLDWVLRQGADEIVVLGWQGGAADHLAANLLLLAAPLPSGTTLGLSAGHTLARVLRGPGRLELDRRPGTRVSLLPLGPVDGVTTGGLQWALDDARLDPGSTLGLANRVDVEGASVRVESGQLLVIEIANSEGGAS
jgi:thiamine pyrophosphokinase